MNDKPYRIKTENDEFHKTKNNFTKGINTGKIGSQLNKEKDKIKDKEEKSGRYFNNTNTSKAVNTNTTMANNKTKIYQND